MYVCMYVCMHACMHVCTYVRTYVCMYIYMYVCKLGKYSNKNFDIDKQSSIALKKNIKPSNSKTAEPIGDLIGCKMTGKNTRTAS